jgi:hypothetical protein
LVTGVEVVAGAAAVYLVRKLRRVGGKADAEVDRALDEGMNALHEAISRKLGPDQALARLETETADGGEPTELTVRRSTDTITQAAMDDSGFAGELKALVARLDELAAAAGQSPATGATINTITNSTVYGPTFQGRDFTGRITTSPDPGAEEAGERGKQQPPAR